MQHLSRAMSRVRVQIMNQFIENPMNTRLSSA
ncbi:hypothetical protein SPAR113_2407, partial [Streptococcus pneumoniae GA49447]